MGQPLAAPQFSKDNLPADFVEELGCHVWSTFRKKTPTRALRINGTFRVITIHGGEAQVCHDGWLALDSEGYPYPIDNEVFQATFEPVGDGDGCPPEAMRLRDRLADAGFSTSDGSDDPTRCELIAALDRYIADRSS